jgi:hypothetical protein
MGNWEPGARISTSILFLFHLKENINTIIKSSAILKISRVIEKRRTLKVGKNLHTRRLDYY